MVFHPRLHSCNGIYREKGLPVVECDQIVLLAWRMKKAAVINFKIDITLGRELNEIKFCLLLITYGHDDKIYSSFLRDNPIYMEDLLPLMDATLTV